MFVLENDCGRIAFDDHGCLAELMTQQHKVNTVRPYLLWRAALTYNGCREVEIRPCTPEIRQEKNTILLHYHQCTTGKGEVLPVDIRCTVTMTDDGFQFGAEIKNVLADSVFREFQYPMIGVKRFPTPPSLINSIDGGERYNNFYENIPIWGTKYCQQDHKFLRRQYLYPGLTGAMNCMLIDFKDWGIYYGCHDDQFDSTMHILELERKINELNVFMVRYPFLKPGDTWMIDTFRIEPYSGTWHCGAKKYRAWAESSWYTPPTPPASVTQSQGWQRLILRQQCGDLLYRYDELMKAWEDCAKAGVDSLFLFGWTKDGMDSGYPVYAPDEQQGGTAAMKKAIAEIRQKGGKVILYYNGQLIDMESDYYKNGRGRHVSIKRQDGSEHREFYNFGGAGSWMNWFGNKAFTVACPACEEWKEILYKHIDYALELGVDSVFFDQLGSIQHLCHDPDHGHEVPFTSIMNSKRKLLKDLRDYLHQRSPDTGLGIEIISDQTAQYSDFIHILVGSGVRSYSEKGVEPFLEFFKYTFPEIILSNRDIRDEIKPVELPVNEMILLGSHSDIEIYRCRTTIAETPHYQEYLGKVNALRARYADLMLTGTFNSTLGYSVDNKKIRSNSFVNGNRMAVVMAHREDTEETVRVTCPPEWHLKEWSSALGDVREENGALILPRYALAVMIFEK